MTFTKFKNLLTAKMHIGHYILVITQ